MKIILAPPIPAFCNHKDVPFLVSPSQKGGTEVAAIAMALYAVESSKRQTPQPAAGTTRHSLWYQVGLLEGVSRNL